MNLLNELVKQTTIYQRLQRDLSMANNEYDKLLFKYEEQHRDLSLRNEDIDKLTDNIKHNKTNARKIYKLTKDKDIRKLCNKILKGEK